jgi:hypothetical protein
VERSPHFVFVVAVAFLACHPPRDLLLQSQLRQLWPLRRLIRLDIKLTDGQTLNVKIVKPPFHQAKPPYAEHTNGKRTNCGSAQSQRPNSNCTHSKTTIDLNLRHKT